MHQALTENIAPPLEEEEYDLLQLNQPQIFVSENTKMNVRVKGRESMPVPKFAHNSPRGHLSQKSRNTVVDQPELEEEDVYEMRVLSNGGVKGHGSESQKSCSKSIELAELSQLQSLVRRHDPNSGAQSVGGSSVPNDRPSSSSAGRNSRSNTAVTTQSLPDSLAQLKLRHHPNATSLSFPVETIPNVAPPKLGGTPNVHCVKLPSLQPVSSHSGEKLKSQPHSSQNKYSRYASLGAIPKSGSPVSKH